MAIERLLNFETKRICRLTHDTPGHSFHFIIIYSFFLSFFFVYSSGRFGNFVEVVWVVSFGSLGSFRFVVSVVSLVPLVSFRFARYGRSFCWFRLFRYDHFALLVSGLSTCQNFSVVK